MTDALRYTCRICRSKTGPTAFYLVDLDFDKRRPLCVPCAEQEELKGAVCEYCGEAATEMTDAGPLCEEHFEHYATGYRIRD